MEKQTWAHTSEIYIVLTNQKSLGFDRRYVYTVTFWANIMQSIVLHLIQKKVVLWSRINRSTIIIKNVYIYIIPFKNVIIIKILWKVYSYISTLKSISFDALLKHSQRWWLFLDGEWKRIPFHYTAQRQERSITDAFEFGTASRRSIANFSECDLSMISEM